MGTRGSALALAQAHGVIDKLREVSPRTEFEVREIRTMGDAGQPSPRLGDGIFVKEIQRALLAGEIDLAVHSLKDVPTEPVAGLVIAAIPRRDDPREALVGSTMERLARGAKVGTSSPRRAAELRRLRPDIEVVPLRGNVPTRIAKARSGEVSAVMLAAAGLSRLNLRADETLHPDRVLPAPAQGALAVEVRERDRELIRLVENIHDPETRNSVAAERRVLRELGGGCLLPLAAWGRVEEGLLRLDVSVTSQDGKVHIRVAVQGPEADYFGLAKRAARELIRRGARDVLQGSS